MEVTEEGEAAAEGVDEDPVHPQSKSGKRNPYSIQFQSQKRRPNTT